MRIRVLLLLTLLATLYLPAFGQGCSLCYTQAASGGSRMIQALRSGILVLIFPPMAICIGIAAMSYKKRNRFRQNDCDGDDLGW
jgi:ABC-type sulfate transport system permease subunit